MSQSSPPVNTAVSSAHVIPPRSDWQRRLEIIVDTMRDMSSQSDPQAMVRSYIQRLAQLRQSDRMVSLSRRDLKSPFYRITRSSMWEQDINPWQQKDRLPVLQGGLLGELVYSDAPRLIENLQIAEDDPAASYFTDQRSLMAIPQFDQGVALNMVILMREQPDAFDREEFPEMVWMSNLFGRATHNLVLSDELRRAYQRVDHEMQVVADIQRSLLPAKLPQIPTMALAAHYQTSNQAGGDYYDFFELADGRWGILIADVSGHGTPAAVVMAILHSIAHTYPGDPTPPGELLSYVNHHLTKRYTGDNGNFVTAFYGIFDPRARSLNYVSAGHNPPRVKHCSQDRISSLDGAQTFPLGIMHDWACTEHTTTFEAGDQIIFYTDGITEAFDPAGKMFGMARLDQTLSNCCLDADQLIAEVLRTVELFTGGTPPTDDRTLLVAKIR